MPAPGEQWETAALPGPRGPFREHVWSLALVTKGTPGQQEDRLHTKVYLTKQESTYHSRGVGLGINTDSERPAGRGQGLTLAAAAGLREPD